MQRKEIRELAKRLAKEYGYLPYMIERYLILWGEEDTLRFLDACERPVRTSIRVNTTKASVEEVQSRLEEKDVKLDRISWLDEGFYAEFGEKNEIGYVDYDDEGNEIRKKVKASVVVDNMIGSFLYFTTQLFDRSDAEFGDGTEAGISGRQKRRMRRMSKALIGKHGILGAVMQFSETLQMFAKFGADNKLPIFDADGKPTGEFVTVDQIADNIVTTLTTFSDTLATKLEKGKVKDASKALAKYDKMIEKLAKLSNSLDGLTKVSASIKDLSDNIGDLAVNVDKLDTSKLQGLTGSIIMGDIQNNTAPRTTRRTGTSPSVAAPRTATRTSEPDWEVISAQIGNAVGAQIASAIKQNQLKFVFSNMGTNEGILEVG